MTLLSVLFWIIIVWWMVLFTVLPLRLGKTGAEKTTAFGAPINPQLLFKFGLTSAITAILVFLIWLLNTIGLIDMASWIIPKS